MEAEVGEPERDEGAERLAQRIVVSLDAEAQSVELSSREAEFVAQYVTNGGRAEAAARGAGYKDAFKQAARLLTQTKIIEAIKRRQEAEAIRQQADALKALPLELAAAHNAVAALLVLALVALLRFLWTPKALR